MNARSWVWLPLVLLLWAAPATAQINLGHKVMGTLGVDAGVQQETGLYVADQFVYYAANTLVDRDGNEVDVGLDSDAVANAIGLAFTYELQPISTYLNASFGIPAASVHVNAERPEASLDRYGFGDLYVQPIELGWRLPHLDVTAGYGFYAPTASTAQGGTGGVGRGHWTHQPTLGFALFFDQARAWRFTTLASYDFNGQKRDIDVRRGDSVQLQGGIGGTFARALTVGVAGYALWQVEDDTGSDLPPLLVGARDRAFGLGPEVGLIVPPIRSKISVRYTRDVSVRSRPEGGLLTLQIVFAAWRPGP